MKSTPPKKSASVVPELTQEEFKLYRNLKQKKYRQQHQLFLVEGFRLLKEMHDAKWPMKCILFEKESEALAETFPWPGYFVKKGGIATLSDVVTSQNLIGVASIKEPPKQNFSRWKKILILEDIADPGNLGTILRSAAAFNIDAVFLGYQCTDVFNSKCIRASMGGIFKLPIYPDQNFSQLLPLLDKQGFQLIGTSPHAKNSLVNYSFPEKTALILSNEAHGSKLQESIAEWVSIPTPGLESLNVAQAASIFLYQLQNPPAPVTSSRKKQ